MIVRTVAVKCDDCGLTHTGLNTNKPKEAREKVFRWGCWSYIDGKDRCGKCTHAHYLHKHSEEMVEKFNTRFNVGETVTYRSEGSSTLKRDIQELQIDQPAFVTREGYARVYLVDEKSHRHYAKLGNISKLKR